MFGNKVEIVRDLLVNRGVETIVIELQVTAPTIKVFRIVIKRDRLCRRGYRRGGIFTMVALVNLLAGKVRANAAQAAVAKEALNIALCISVHLGGNELCTIPAGGSSRKRLG